MPEPTMGGRSTGTPTMEGGGVQSWRIANGAFARGRGHGGEESRATIDGILGRVGTYEYHNDDGELVRLLEVELDKDGERLAFHCKIGLKKSDSNVTAMQLAQGLLPCKAGDWILVQPERSKDPIPGREGSYLTYVRVGIVDPETLKARPVQIPSKEFPGESSKERFPHALGRLQDMPNWAVRTKRPRDDESEDRYDPETGELRETATAPAAAPARATNPAPATTARPATSPADDPYADTPPARSAEEDLLDLARANDYRAILTRWNVTGAEWANFVSRLKEFTPEARASEAFCGAILGPGKARSIDDVVRLATYDPFTDA